MSGLPALNAPQRTSSVENFYGRDWVAQVKLDGIRLAILFGRDGRPNTAYTMGKAGKQHRLDVRGLELPELPPMTVLDGELACSSLQAAQKALVAADLSGWVPFDICLDPAGIATGGIAERVAALGSRGFSPLVVGSVRSTWAKAQRAGAEGVIIRRRGGLYGATCFKYKPPRTVNVISHKGSLFVLRDGRPICVGSTDRRDVMLKIVVAVEGVTERGRLRAQHFGTLAPADADVSATQIERWVRDGRAGVR
jgi:hypothetical protein